MLTSLYKMASFSKSRLSNLILFIIILSAFIYMLYWLWQRQPTIKSENQNTKRVESVQSTTENKSQVELQPANNSIVKEENLSIRGKYTPSSYILIYSNDFSSVSTSDNSGIFEIEIPINMGLNQLGIASLNPNDFESSQKDELTYYLSDKEEINQNSQVYAGVVKTIFDSLLTITTPQGEAKIQTNSNPEIILPDDEDESTIASSLNNIRIGDFAISLGTIDEKDLMTSEILEILRDNKPRLTNVYALVNILKSPQDEIFSATNLEDNKILELIYNRNTEVVTDSAEIEINSIEEQNQAIIFYSQKSAGNLVSKIFLLP